jgi:hypothetical protein
LGYLEEKIDSPLGRLETTSIRRWLVEANVFVTVAGFVEESG